MFCDLLFDRCLWFVCTDKEEKNRLWKERTGSIRTHMRLGQHSIVHWRLVSTDRCFIHSPTKRKTEEKKCFCGVVRECYSILSFFISVSVSFDRFFFFLSLFFRPLIVWPKTYCVSACMCCVSKMPHIASSNHGYELHQPPLCTQHQYTYVVWTMDKLLWNYFSCVFVCIRVIALLLKVVYVTVQYTVTMVAWISFWIRWRSSESHSIFMLPNVNRTIFDSTRLSHLVILRFCFEPHSMRNLHRTILFSSSSSSPFFSLNQLCVCVWL